MSSRNVKEGEEWEEDYNPNSDFNQPSSSQDILVENEDWESVSSINNIIPTITSTASSSSPNIFVPQEDPVQVRHFLP